MHRPQLPGQGAGSGRQLVRIENIGYLPVRGNGPAQLFPQPVQRFLGDQGKGNIGHGRKGPDKADGILRKIGRRVNDHWLHADVFALCGKGI